MKFFYRGVLIAVLMVDLTLIGWISLRGVAEQIPESMWTYIGKEEKLFSNLPVQAEENEAVQALHLTTGDGTSVRAETKGNYEVSVKLFGLLPLKTIQVKVMDPMELIPSGEPVGIYVETSGLLVLSTTSVEGEDGLIYEPAGNVVQTGDYIMQIGSQPVKTIKEFNAAVQSNGEKRITILIRRNGETTRVSIKPVRAKDGSFRLGIWVREDAQGIGTMTYVTEKGKFGALGHGVTDADTGTLMKLGGGELFQTQILDIVKGQKGDPGELEGYINMVADNCIGTIGKNTSLGIFGELDTEYKNHVKEKALPVGLKQDIHEGDAYIYSRMEGKQEKYKVRIESINISSMDNKGMVICVTDQELLSVTGGIVQGMSGSPIVQDGKLIGAVTHVFVDDPTRGYGAFIENMLSQ